MSFSFSAQGSRAETLESLEKNTNLSPDGEAVLELVAGVVEEAPESGADGTPLRFTVSAHGHTGTGQVPSLHVSLTTEYAR